MLRIVAVTTVLFAAFVAYQYTEATGRNGSSVDRPTVSQPTQGKLLRGFYDLVKRPEARLVFTAGRRLLYLTNVAGNMFEGVTLAYDAYEWWSDDS